MPWEINTEGLDQMADDFFTASTLVGREIAEAASIARLEGEVADKITVAMMAATPIGKGNPFYKNDKPGQLKASTLTEMRVHNEDRATDVELLTSQERLAHANRDGSGGGYDVTEYVLKGRAGITAPSSGTHSTGKHALLTPWGFRRSVDKADPAESPDKQRPYPDAAYGAIMTASTAFLRRWGETVFEHVGMLLGMEDHA